MEGVGKSSTAVFTLDKLEENQKSEGEHSVQCTENSSPTESSQEKKAKKTEKAGKEPLASSGPSPTGEFIPDAEEERLRKLLDVCPPKKHCESESDFSADEENSSSRLDSKLVNFNNAEGGQRSRSPHSGTSVSSFPAIHPSTPEEGSSKCSSARGGGKGMSVSGSSFAEWSGAPMLEEGEIHYCVYEKRMLYHILAATSFLLWVPYSCAALYIAYCDSFSIVSDEGGFPRPHRNYPAIYYLFFREGFDLLLFMYHAVPVFLFSLIVASISTWLAMMPKRFTLSYLVAFSWFLGIISFYFWSTDVVHTSKTESFLTSSNPSQSSPWERLQAKGVSWASESWGNGPLPAPFVLQRFSGSSVFSSTCNETNSSSSLFSWLNSCGSHLPSSPVMWDANFFSFLLKHGLVRVDDHLPTPPSWMWLVVSLSTGAISAVLCKALDRLHWKQERKHYAMWKSREDISSKQGQLDVSGGEPSNDSMAQYSAMSPASSAPFIAYSSSSHGKLPSPASLAENSARHVPAAYSSPSSNLMWSISCFPSQKGIADGEEALTRSANATPPAAKRRDRIVIRPRPRKDTRKSTVATIHLSLVIPFCTGQWFSMMLRYGWRGFLIQNIVVTVTLGFIGYSMICLQVLRKRLRRSQRATSDYQTVVLKPKTLADGTKCTEQNEVLVEMVNYRVDYVHFVYRLFSTKMGIVVLAVVAFHVYVASWMLTMIRTLHTLNALVTGAGILAEILVFDLL